MTPLDEINRLIRDEHGKRVKPSDKLVDSEVDSFGLTMVLLELDELYGCFGKEWFKETSIPDLTIQDMLDRIENEGKQL